MKAKLATILLGVLALTGSEAAGQTSADKACRGLVITADDQAPGRGGPVFSARGVLDVKLRMLFPASFKPDREELLRQAGKLAPLFEVGFADFFEGILKGLGCQLEVMNLGGRILAFLLFDLGDCTGRTADAD